MVAFCVAPREEELDVGRFGGEDEEEEGDEGEESGRSDGGGR